MTAHLKPDNWLMSDDEMDAMYATQSETVEDAIPSLESQQQAERHLQSMAHWEARKQALVDHAIAEHDRIDAWLASNVGPIDRRLAWHRRGLEAFCLNLGKSVKLIYGTLKYKAGRERIEVSDPVTFLAWAKENALELIRLKVIEEPDKTAIKNHIHLGKAIPPGSDMVVAPDSVDVELAL